MSEVMEMTTYDAYRQTPAIHGVPGIAFRLGLALENWARAAARREAARSVRALHRIEADARVAHDHRVGFRPF